MRWVVWIRTLGLGLQYGAGGGGLAVGLGLWGGLMVEMKDAEGCALIGLGAKVGDIHRGVKLPPLGCKQGI